MDNNNKKSIFNDALASAMASLNIQNRQPIEAKQKEINAKFKEEIVKITTHMSEVVAKKMIEPTLRAMFNDSNIYVNEERDPSKQNAKYVDIIMPFSEQDDPKNKNKKIIPIALLPVNINDAMLNLMKVTQSINGQKTIINNEDDATKALICLANQNALVKAAYTLNKHEANISIEVNNEKIAYELEFKPLSVVEVLRNYSTMKPMIYTPKPEEEKNRVRSINDIDDIEEKFKKIGINKQFFDKITTITANCATMIGIQAVENQLRGFLGNNEIYVNRERTWERNEIDVIMAYDEPRNGTMENEKIIPVSLTLGRISNPLHSLIEKTKNQKILESRIYEVLNNLFELNGAILDKAINALNNNGTRTSKDNGDTKIISNKVSFAKDGQQVTYNIRYIRSESASKNSPQKNS